MRTLSQAARALIAWSRTPAGLLFLTLALTYLYFLPMAGWNENSRLDLTRAIVEEGRLWIDSYHMNTGDKAACGTHYCTDKAPGASFIAVPAYLAYRSYLKLRGRPLPKARVLFASAERARRLDLRPGDRIQVNESFLGALYVAALCTSILPGALAAWLLIGFCRRLGIGREASLVASATYGLATVAFPYSTVLFGHQLAASSLLGAFVLARRGCEGATSAKALLGAGALAGLATAAEYPAAVPAAIIGSYLLVVLPKRRAVLWFVLGGLGWVVLLGLYHWASFGRPVAIGYGNLANPEFAAGQGVGFFGVTYPRAEALYGLLFGRFRGLLYASPVLALAGWGLVRWWSSRRARAEVLTCVAIVGFFLLLNGSYYMWWGGAAAGPRHLIPMLPFLCLLLAPAWAGRLRWLYGALLVVSALNMLALTGAGVDAPEHGDILLDYAWPTVLGLVRRARSSHGTVGEWLGLSSRASLLALLAIWALAGWQIWAASSADRRIGHRRT